jgi:2-oxoglutarate ferredoxin oxidoreductase subunit beta
MTLKASEFSNQVQTKWCPGCGDNVILKQLQQAMADSGSLPHNSVVVSGIGCSGRLPYYMNTYGFHTIHGRSFPIACGVKIAKPETEVWVITGDGDALSIGSNHFIHFFRRQLDINVVLINNQIYGLTKGQKSPTSAKGQRTKTSPQGSQDMMLSAVSLALSSGSGFVARSLDRLGQFTGKMMREAKDTKGPSLLEVYQNCPIFSNGVFDDAYQNHVILEDQKPIVYQEKALAFHFNRGFYWTDEIESDPNVWIHEIHKIHKAIMLNQYTVEKNTQDPDLFGIFYKQTASNQEYQMEQPSKIGTILALNSYKI